MCYMGEKNNIGEEIVVKTDKVENVCTQVSYFMHEKLLRSLKKREMGSCIGLRNRSQNDTPRQLNATNGNGSFRDELISISFMTLLLAVLQSSTGMGLELAMSRTKFAATEAAVSNNALSW